MAPIQLSEYIVFALVAVLIYASYIGAVAALRKNPVREKLKRFTPVGSIDAGFAYADSKATLADICENLLSAFGVDIPKAKREMYFTMARAGLMSNSAIVYYLAFVRFAQPLLLLLGVLVLLYGMSLGPTATGGTKLQFFLMGMMLAVAGVYGARLYLSNRTGKRKKLLQSSFADTLDLLLVCVESGLPLDGALARIAREVKRTSPEIAEEMDRTRIELSILGDRVQAMQNLLERTDTPGFKALVPALIQTEKFGTSISDTLRVLSDEQRYERQMQAEGRAAKIPVMITLPLMLFILPPIFIIILSPPIIKIKQQGGVFGPSKAGK